jgi:DNA invertase Pin-like site-specific DNA recombinase
MAIYGYARVSTDGQSLASQDAHSYGRLAARKSMLRRSAAVEAIGPSLPSCSSGSIRAMC